MSIATEQKRTPWSVKPAFHVPGFHIMTPSIGGRTFRLFSSDHATAEEAQLAAAAPELLEALVRVEKLATLFLSGAPLPDGESLDAWLEQARAAIAKAQGDAQ